MTPPQMITALKNNLIDGFIAWEPYCARAVVDGGYVLAKTSDIEADHPCCVLAVRNSFLDIAPALIYVKSKAKERMNSGKNYKIRAAEAFTGQSKDVCSLALENINYSDFPDVVKIMDYASFLEENSFIKKMNERTKAKFFDNFLRKDIYDETVIKIKKGWKPEKINKEITIGYLNADLHQLEIYIAQQKNLFGDYFSSVSFLPFSNGPAVMSAFKSGAIDAAYLGAAPALLKSLNERINISIIAAANDNGSAIVLKNDESDLNNKTIATPGFGTMQDMFLRKYLKKNGYEIEVK